MTYTRRGTQRFTATAFYGLIYSMDTKDIKARAALGLEESALRPLSGNVYLHQDVIAPYQMLADAAQREGFSLQVASGYRSFERQLAIFNAKASGQRPVLDDCGEPVDMTSLSDTDKLWAILRYSALPGASRHHWGSDMDVYDGSALPEGYSLQLTPSECCQGGVFAELHQWLDDYLPTCDFYRPYARDTGGVAPEPWHLSYAPLAETFSDCLTPDVLARQLAVTDIALQSAVLDNITTIFQRYVRI
ncbi:M15 family metallopeptidase [Gilvimarinus agarilyticus]|uniref:M15 family metallopeptidase n=1 Tax=Gilvimarinus agarilyticus TaxID=679259 RepID=UPI000A68ABFF|nr:M15 family metallopeptidase [Gilvimarinus agarilyticus]